MTLPLDPPTFKFKLLNISHLLEVVVIWRRKIIGMDPDTPPHPPLLLLSPPTSPPSSSCPPPILLAGHLSLPWQETKAGWTFSDTISYYCPCVYLSKRLPCVLNVDNILLFSRSLNHIICLWRNILKIIIIEISLKWMYLSVFSCILSTVWPKFLPLDLWPEPALAEIPALPCLSSELASNCQLPVHFTAQQC